jgi:uncharacterized membrane protein YeiH
MWHGWQQTFAEYLQGDQFRIPVYFDLGATFFFGLTGALAAMRRGYDIVGLFGLALVTGLGGALIRDGLFIQNGPPAFTADPRYLLVLVPACVGGMIGGRWVERFPRLIATLDALGLGAYGVVGLEKSLAAGLSVPAAVLVGVINACGGGVVRDILVREEPLVFKPGQLYALAALAGCLFHVALVSWARLPLPLSGLLAFLATFLFRVLTIRFNWTSKAVKPIDLMFPPP